MNNDTRQALAALPPLPEPTVGLGAHRWAYGPEDMQAYARAALAATQPAQPSALPVAKKLVNDFARACLYGSDDERIAAGAALETALVSPTAQPSAQGEAVALSDEDWQAIADEADSVVWSRLKQAVNRRLAMLASAPAAPAQPVPKGEPVAWDKATERREVQAWRDWAWKKDGDPVGLMAGQLASMEGWLARAKLASAPAAPAQAVPPKVAKTLIAALRDGNFNATNIEPAELNAAADWVLASASAPAAPAAPAQAVAGALTEEQIDEMWEQEKARSVDMSLKRQWLRFARAIERAHGIAPKDEQP